MNNDFMECAVCAAKPGSPMLCSSCLNNRATIARLALELEKVIEINRRIEMEEFDISSEEYREVVFMLNGSVYHIDNPITLRHQRGSNEHHVTDAQGLTHTYSAPSTGLTAVRWKLREENRK